MKPLWALVLLLLVIWLLSMFLFWPLPLVVALFAAVVSLSSMGIWMALMERRTRRT
jgi:hypothetical protein